MNTELHGRAGRAWPSGLIAVVLASTRCRIAIMSSQAAAAGVEASAEVDRAMAFVRHVAFLLIVGLFAWHQRRVLIKLAGRNGPIGAEIMLLLAIV